jgi:hypothetical protein
MGMYTEVVVKVNLANTITDSELSVIKYLFDNGEKPEVLPDHPFFSCPRWHFIGQCSSYYHHPAAVNSLYASEGDPNDYYLFSRSDLKNYDNEISLFFDWIAPLTTSNPGDVLGYSWYEEDKEPTLMYNRYHLQSAYCIDVDELEKLLEGEDTDANS